MLEHTFIHLPDIGPIRERQLWEDGVKDWDDFLERFSSSPQHRIHCKKVASSKYALKLGDANHFALALSSNETWRAFPHFRDVAYLDIETTGLGNGRDYITVIGVYDGKGVHSYVCGDNLEDFRKDIQKYNMVVTFNGSQFDLPFIRNGMPGIRLPRLHVDLRFLLASLDVTGGLKRIEKQFGMEREDDLKGLDGYDAVKLWQKFRRNGNPAALDKLVRYNAADISNLKNLMEWAYKEKRRRTGFDGIP
jgi:uncharacterized protein YprB with RNaseH-like and TPR domain